MAEAGRAPALTVSLVVLLVAALAAGCGLATEPNVARARSVITDTTAKEPDYQRYFLSIARGSSAPSVRADVLAALGSDNFQTALVAVDALDVDPPAEALEPLRQVFASKGGALKREAAIELARLDDASALEYLKTLTADPAQTLSIPATVLIAGSPGGEEFLTPLLRARMEAEDPSVRAEAYAAAGEIGERWSTNLLLEGLQAVHAEERQPVISALGRTGDPRAAKEIVPFVNTRGLVFASLEALGELGNADALPAVKKMADSDEAVVRVYAAVALWKLGDKEDATAKIDELIQNEDPTVRSVLAEQLGSITDPGAQSRLAALAADDSKEVRVEALRAIAEQRRPEFVPTLREAAGDPDYEVSTLALTALGHVGGPDSLGEITPLLDSENPYVALSAAVAVLDIESRTTTP